MPTEVKICGLSTPETVEVAIASGADLIGFVFYPKSPRNVSVATAKALARIARGKAKIVALIVDADDTLIDEITGEVAPDFFQAHGAETPARIAEISRLSGKPVIKAIKVRTDADVVRAKAYEAVAALILFDAKAPETLAGALPGGNGIAFDWKLVGSGGAPSSFILSGGLDPDNVARAIEATGAGIVDVSSGVEKSPGIKDINLIREFIAAAKAAP